MALSTIQNNSFADTAVHGRRNLIINGAMQVAQRGTSATGVGGNASYPTLDRFRQNTSNTAGRFTMSQVAVTDLPGFANCLKLQCTTADTSIAANELGIIMQRIEGQNLQQLKKGTSSAEPVTVSFYVKGNASATYTLELADNDNSRQISQTFPVTTSWNRVSLTFAGDTSGVLGNDNGNSLELNIWIHAGSDFNGGTLSTTWTGTTNANRASSSATSFFDSTSRTLEITGLQMEVGSQATPFEHRSYGEELSLCQRYYHFLGGDTPYQSINTVGAYNASEAVGFFRHPVEMRAAPSISKSGNWVGLGFGMNVGQSISADQNGKKTLQLGCTGGSGGTAGKAGTLRVNNDSSFRLKFDAEL